MIARILCLTLFGILLSSHYSGAFQIGYEHIAELQKQADYVALVRVDRGEALFSGEKMCGVKYNGKVIDGIKGISKGELLEWYTAAYLDNYSLQVGTPYILFLSKPGRVDPFRPEGAIYDRRKELKEVCSSIKEEQENRVIHSGYGALRVELEDPIFDQWKGAVIIPNFVIALPDTLNRKEDRPEPLLYVRVQLQDLVAYLISLKP